MENSLTQLIIPFILTSLIVIIITIIAERYGTKTGGIIGTIPHPTIIAFIFIALNQTPEFAALSVSIVPAAVGINILFLLTFTLLIHRSLILAIITSLIIWAILASILYLITLTNIFLAILLFMILVITGLLFLDHYKKIASTGRVKVHYTPVKILIRGLLGGAIISIAVLLSNIGPVISGIFSVFPAISLSTMIISVREHGPEYAGGMAKALIYGSPSVIFYALAIHFLYPQYGIIIGTIVAYLLSLITAFILYKSRGIIK